MRGKQENISDGTPALGLKGKERKMKFYIFMLCVAYFIQLISILGLIKEMTKPKISFKSDTNKGHYYQNGEWRNEQGQKIEQLVLPNGSIPGELYKLVEKK